MQTARIPSREDILAARGSRLPDLIAPHLKVLFCGINPGLYSGAVGHHFARPGNRFWPVLYAAGFTKRLLSPFEEHELLKDGYGLTNIVGRATAGSEDLSKNELITSGRKLIEKIEKNKPERIAFLGIGAYRIAFGRSKARPGKQNDHVGDTAVWVLPSPSGLNAYYRFEDLVRFYRELRLDAEKSQR